MNTAGGTLSAAIIAGLIVVFMKIYDHYHQQSIREYKDILDIQKNIQDSDIEEKEKIKGIVLKRSKVFLETQELKDIENSKGFFFREAVYYLRVLGLLSVFAFFALSTIAITLFYTDLIGDMDAFVPWLVVTGITLTGCGIIKWRIDESFKRELEMKELDSDVREGRDNGNSTN